MSQLDRDSKEYFVKHVRHVVGMTSADEAIAKLTNEQIDHRYRAMLELWWDIAAYRGARV